MWHTEIRYVHSSGNEYEACAWIRLRESLVVYPIAVPKGSFLDASNVREEIASPNDQLLDTF